MMEIVKILITILLMPLMIIILIGAVLIGVHEALWYGKQWKINPKGEDKI